MTTRDRSHLTAVDDAHDTTAILAANLTTRPSALDKAAAGLAAHAAAAADRIAAAAASDYDTRLLNLARTAAAARTVDDMRQWLRERAAEEAHADSTAAVATVDEADDRTVTALFNGHAKAIMGELVRWIERLTGNRPA